MRELLLPRGHWHVVLVEDERELHRIENVRVDAGIEVHDSRFMEFDWRAFATLVTLRIEDKDGEPFDECSVMHQYGNRGRGHEPKAGVIRWLVAKEGGDLSVHPRGHRFAAVPLGRITGERVVRIGGGPELVVQLAVVPKLPDDGALFAFLDQSYNALPFDTEGKLSVWLHEPGERTLRIGLRKGNSMHWLDVVAQPITVPAAGLTHRLELPAGLQAAIDRVTR